MILLTSRESKEDVIAGLESGADDYLIKPFIADELKARLRVGERILHLEDRLGGSRADAFQGHTRSPDVALEPRRDPSICWAASLLVRSAKTFVLPSFSAISTISRISMIGTASGRGSGPA